MMYNNAGRGGTAFLNRSRASATLIPVSLLAFFQNGEIQHQRLLFFTRLKGCQLLHKLHRRFAKQIQDVREQGSQGDISVDSECTTVRSSTS
jgi:hypothetical protein